MSRNQCWQYLQAIGGLYNEFIGSQRLDNLVGAYTAITGLLESLNDGSLAEDSNMRVVACYDNEEVILIS